MKENKTKRVLGVTLARGGSVSVPKKNIFPLNNVPLIAYTIVEAKRSNCIDRYIVSTDDQAIADVALDYGAEVPFLRPAELATNTSTTLSGLQHAVTWVEREEGRKYDVVVELPCTNPMRTGEDIDAAVNKLTDTGADSVVGVCKLDDNHPIRIKKIVDDKIVDFCLKETPETRRQDLKPDAYIRNGSIYAVNRNCLMVGNSRYGTENSRPLIMSPEKIVNIDGELELLLAEVMIGRYPRDYIKKLGEQ